MLNRQDPDVISLVAESVAAIRAAPHDARRWAALGMAYEANAMVDVARQSYERALALDASEPRWWYRLAIVRSRLGDLDGAMAAVRRVVDSGVGYAPAYWRLGSWLLDQNSLSGAADAFKRAIEIDPADPAGGIGLGRVFLHQGDDQAAIDVLERLLAAHPTNVHGLQLLATAYRRRGRLDEATVLPAAGRGYQVSPDPWTDELVAYRRGFGAVLEEAVSLFRSGEFDHSAELFERLRKNQPTDFTLLNQLAAAYVAAGRPQQALAVLHGALEAAPDHFETHFNLAGAYFGHGDVARALEHADRAIAISPSHGRGYERKGTILLRAERYQEALETFRLAVRFDPRNIMALMSMAMMHYNDGNLVQALANFERVVREDPSLVEAHIGRAMVYMDQTDLNRADRALARAEQLNPRHPQVITARERREALASSRQPALR